MSKAQVKANVVDAKERGDDLVVDDGVVMVGILAKVTYIFNNKMLASVTAEWTEKDGKRHEEPDGCVQAAGRLAGRLDVVPEAWATPDGRFHARWMGPKTQIDLECVPAGDDRLRGLLVYTSADLARALRKTQ